MGINERGGHTMIKVKIEDRRDMCYIQGVTLNEKSAKISGALNNFGTVRFLDDPFLGVEFSWECIKKVLRKDKAFKL